MTDDYENGVFSREHGLYHFSKYSPEEAYALKLRDLENEMEKGKAKEAAMAAKLAAKKAKPAASEAS